MGQATNMTESNYDELTKGVCLIDFWAPWCGPCRLLGPTIDTLASEFSGKVNVCKVNVDEQESLAQRFGVRSIPMVVVLKNGKIVQSSTGVKEKDFFKKIINDALASK